MNNEPIPSLRALATGIPEKSHRQEMGLGFKNESTDNPVDAFAGYYKTVPTKDSKGIVLETGSTQYKTLYDQQTNTYTTVPLASSTQQPTQSSQVLNGFVNPRIAQVQDPLPVSSYGGPDDEWDSSKMALESALAAIRARRGVESERGSNRHRSPRVLEKVVLIVIIVEVVLITIIVEVIPISIEAGVVHIIITIGIMIDTLIVVVVIIVLLFLLNKASIIGI